MFMIEFFGALLVRTEGCKPDRILTPRYHADADEWDNAEQLLNKVSYCIGALPVEITRKVQLCLNQGLMAPPFSYTATLSINFGGVAHGYRSERVTVERPNETCFDVDGENIIYMQYILGDLVDALGEDIKQKGGLLAMANTRIVTAQQNRKVPLYCGPAVSVPFATRPTDMYVRPDKS